MKGLMNVFIALMILFCSMMLILLLGHIISYVFGYGWKLAWDNKGACAVIGIILGIISIIAYWYHDEDSGN